MPTFCAAKLDGFRVLIVVKNLRHWNWQSTAEFTVDRNSTVVYCEQKFSKSRNNICNIYTKPA